MAMTVKRVKDTRTPRVFMHKLADIRGGVSIKTAELGGDYIREGAVLSAPDESGICHIVKCAQVTADVASSGVDINVKKYHNFKVGDFVLAGTGGVAYAISSIDTSNKNYDVIKVATTLGAISKDSFIAEAAAKSTTNTGALKYTPIAEVGTGKSFDGTTNVDTDAILVGVTKGNPLPSFITLKGIINY